MTTTSTTDLSPTRRAHRRVMAWLVVACLVVAGCASRDGSDEATRDPSDTAPTTTATAVTTTSTATEPVASPTTTPHSVATAPATSPSTTSITPATATARNRTLVSPLSYPVWRGDPATEPARRSYPYSWKSSPLTVAVVERRTATGLVDPVLVVVSPHPMLWLGVPSEPRGSATLADGTEVDLHALANGNFAATYAPEPPDLVRDPGTGTEVIVVGSDPLAFLHAAGGSPVSGVSGGIARAAHDYLEATIDAVPDGWVLTVPPTPIVRGAPRAALETTRRVRVEVSSGPGVVDALFVAPIVRLELGDGVDRWAVTDPVAGAEHLMWRLEDGTWIRLSGPDRASVVDAIDDLDFVDERSWQMRYPALAIGPLDRAAPGAASGIAPQRPFDERAMVFTVDGVEVITRISASALPDTATTFTWSGLAVVRPDEATELCPAHVPLDPVFPPDCDGIAMTPVDPSGFGWEDGELRWDWVTVHADVPATAAAPASVLETWIDPPATLMGHEGAWEYRARVPDECPPRQGLRRLSELPEVTDLTRNDPAVELVAIGPWDEILQVAGDADPYRDRLRSAGIEACIVEVAHSSDVLRATLDGHDAPTSPLDRYDVGVGGRIDVRVPIADAATVRRIAATFPDPTMLRVIGMAVIS